MRQFIERLWYKNHVFSWFLLPFSYLFAGFSWLRRWFLIRYAQNKFPIPLIIIGNLTVGGVGKTPLVIECIRQCQNRGLKVAVVSRGYGGSCTDMPHQVLATDAPSVVGDEPLLLVQKTGVPVVIDRNRSAAVAYLISNQSPDIIISDDGLQHYRMGRSIEVLVVDGTRMFGNKRCLPAGPLREPLSRLNTVDFIVVNEGDGALGSVMKLIPEQIIHLATGQSVPAEQFKGPVAAVAGIGNPQRFYSTLTQLGIKFAAYDFPDHHEFNPEDVHIPGHKVIMTEKDAVKCRHFGSNDLYYLTVKAELDESFWQELWSSQHLKRLSFI